MRCTGTLLFTIRLFTTRMLVMFVVFWTNVTLRAGGRITRSTRVSRNERSGTKE